MNWKIGLVIFLIALTSKILFFTNHVPFTQDQVKDVMIARNYLAEKNYLIPYGPKASVGVYIPPLYYYLQMFGQLVMPEEFYATDYLIIILESLTPVLVFYLIFWICNNTLASFGGALIYLISPGVLGASSAWNPHLVPLFGLIFVISFMKYIFQKKWWGLMGGLLSLGVLVNLHFQWFVLIPLVIVMLAVAGYRIKNSWKILFLSVILILAMLWPYYYYEIGHGWSNTKSAVEFLKNGGLIYEQVRKPAYVAVFFSNFYMRMITGDLFVTSWDKQYEIIHIPMIVGSVLFWVIILVNLYWLRRTNNKKLALYMVIFGTMFIFLRFYKGAKPDFYIYIFMHFVFVLIGTLIGLAGKKWPKFLQIIPFLVIMAIELLAISKIPPYNDYADFTKISEQVNKTATGGVISIEILNQELEIPLDYFLKGKYVEGKMKDETNYYVLVCYTSQGCDKYEPNKNTVNNIYKRNNIDKTDYSYYWPKYNPNASFVVAAGRYRANFLRVN